MAEIRNKATLDATPFNTGLGRMESRVQGFASKLSSMGRMMGVGLSGAALVGMARNTLNTADEIDNLAKQSGLAIDEVQALKLATEEAGMQFETMRPTINQFRRAMEQAQSGNKQYRESFEALGLSMGDLARMDVGQALSAVSRAMVDGKNSAIVQAEATKVLGAESTRLRGVLDELGTVGVDGLIDKYKELGLVMEDDVVKAADRMEESLSRASKNMKTKLQNEGTKGLLNLAAAWKDLTGLIEGNPNKSADFIGEMLGIESSKLLTPEQRAQQVERQAEAEAQAKRMAEERAKNELQVINEKRRFRSLSEQQQQKELRNKASELQAEIDKADSAQRRLELTKELFEVEKKIREEKEQEKQIDGVTDFRVGQFARIGGNTSNNLSGIVLTQTQQRQLRMQEELNKTAKAQERILRDIASRRGGAIF